MRLKVKHRQNQAHPLSIFFVAGLFYSALSCAWATTPMTDENLSQNRDELEKITPAVITELQHDRQQPESQQKQKQQQIAALRTQENREENLQSGVLSMHEVQKKTTQSTRNSTTQSSKEQYTPTTIRMVNQPMTFKNTEFLNFKGSADVSIMK